MKNCSEESMIAALPNISAEEACKACAFALCEEGTILGLDYGIWQDLFLKVRYAITRSRPLVPGRLTLTSALRFLTHDQHGPEEKAAPGLTYRDLWTGCYLARRALQPD